MSKNLEALKADHEKLRLEKRAVDRVTEDTRTKEIEDKRKNADEIEALEKAIEDKKELVASLNEKNKVLKITADIVAKEIEAKKAAQEVEYDEKRRAKQKNQFLESKLCTKKVNIEKKCDPIEVMNLQLKELAEQVEACKVEREEVKKHYSDEMNREGNIISKLKFQVQTLDKKVADREAEHSKILAKLNEVKTKGKDDIKNKDLLIQRLDFDTGRVEKSIPKIEADLVLLEKMVKN